MLTGLDPDVAPDTVTTVHCWRCGHTWLPRLVGRAPVKCPACKSPYYTTPRRTRKPRLGQTVDKA